MPRKASRNARGPSRAAPKPFAIDHASDHKGSKNQPEVNNSAASKALQKNKKTNGAGGSSPQGTSSGDEADGDFDVAEDDEDEEDDENGDAFAPLGRAIEGHGDQAGRTDAAQYDSDDEVYNRVDEISDSDADEPGVERLEEKDIIASEKDHGSSRPATFSGPVGEASDVWEGFDLENGFFTSEIPYFDEHLGRIAPGLLDNDIELLQFAGAYDDLEPMPSLPQSSSSTRRRVHFNEPIFPPSDSSVTGDEDLNGLFNTAHVPSMEADLDFDFENHEKDHDDDGSSVGSSSGYETDYGDTTDEDDVPASATTRPQSLIRQPSLSSLDANLLVMPSAGPSSAPSPFKVPATPIRQIQGPRMGSFKADPTKPFAMIDSTGDNILITPARRPPRADAVSSQVPSTRTSTTNASPVLSHPALATPVNDSDYDMSDFSKQVPTDPMLTAGSESMADLLLPFGPTMHTRNSSQASGDVFYPMDRMGDVNAVYAADDQEDDDDDDDDDEGLLNVEDFIDFGVDSSDDDAGGDLDTSLPTPVSTSPTGAYVRPKMPSPNNPAPHDLLAHFDKGIAGVFRQGQNQHHQRLRRPSGALSLSNHAFKKGRHAPADSPVTPPQKRKMSGGFAPAGPFGPATKRKLMNHR